METIVWYEATKTHMVLFLSLLYIILGDMIYMSALGRSVLILNNTLIAKELIEKQAKNFSDRPITVMAGELIGLDQVPTFRTSALSLL